MREQLAREILKLGRHPLTPAAIRAAFVQEVHLAHAKGSYIRDMASLTEARDTLTKIAESSESCGHCDGTGVVLLARSSAVCAKCGGTGNRSK